MPLKYRLLTRKCFLVDFKITHNTSDGLLTFGPAFNLPFLMDVLKLQQSIEAIGESQSNGLEKHCFAPITHEGEVPVRSQCVVQSVLGYFQNSEKNLEKSSIVDGYTKNYLNHFEKCLR